MIISIKIILVLINNISIKPTKYQGCFLTIYKNLTLINRFE